MQICDIKSTQLCSQLLFTKQIEIPIVIYRTDPCTQITTGRPHLAGGIDLTTKSYIHTPRTLASVNGGSVLVYATSLFKAEGVNVSWSYF